MKRIKGELMLTSFIQSKNHIITCVSLCMKKKQTNIALHVAEHENHPVHKLLRDQEVYDEYALRRKLSKPFFIGAQEECATLGVDLGTVECVKELEHPSWINNNSDNMINQLMSLPKGSGLARIRAELETIIEEKGFPEYARVHTDGSVMDERSGCAIVKIRLTGQMSIFNAEVHAIIQAIKITRRWGMDKRIIMTVTL
jgi:hypothetical protein